MDYEENWEVIEEDLTSGDLWSLSKDVLEGYKQIGMDCYDGISDFSMKNWLDNNKYYLSVGAAAAFGHLVIPERIDLGPLDSVIYDDLTHFAFGASTGGVGEIAKTLTAGGITGKEVVDATNNLGWMESVKDAGITISGILMEEYVKEPIYKIKDRV